MQTGQVRVVARPIAILGEQSVWAAEAAFCANDQGKFWEYSDRLYANLTAANRVAFTKPNLKQFAAELGLNAEVFGASLDQGKYNQRVRDETEEARKLGISSTPTFFVGDEKILGALPFYRFKTAIEAQLR